MSNYISDEKIYYRISDKYIQKIRNMNIQIFKDYGHYYCIISIRQLYQLFPNSSNIWVKYRYQSCNQIHIIDCQNIRKKLQKNQGKLLCPKCIKKYALYKYSNNNVAVSKQQKYFYNLFKPLAELNYPINSLFIDIAFLSLKIGIEYNGGEHDLSYKLFNTPRSQFINREWRRRYFLKNLNWKMIYIIAERDKINLYSMEEYIKIFNYIYLLLQTDYMVEMYPLWN